MRIRDWSSDVCSSDLPSLEAHKLIEEMMIQANVCAAETLEAKRSPLIYRIHDTPSPEKVQALADFLQTLGTAWRSEERRVGKECVSTCRARWSQRHEKKTRHTKKKTRDQNNPQ